MNHQEDNKINPLANGSDIQIILKEILSKETNIEFAYIFGSQVKNTYRFKSDLDIAVFFTSEPELPEIGRIVSELERSIDTEIDLVSLNNLYNKNPELAYNIISEGILIFSKNNSLLTKYKSSVYLAYLDIKSMLDVYHNKFLQRLHNKRFAER